MMIDFFMECLQASPEHEAVVSSEFSVTFAELIRLISTYEEWLDNHRIAEGSVVSFSGDYSPGAIALFMALAKKRCIVIPLSQDSQKQFSEFRDIGETEYDVAVNDETLELTVTGRTAGHPIYAQLREARQPGLVLFSSGSTGKSKAIVQNLEKLMLKFRQPRKAMRMLIFLQLDHIGGVNSLLYSLANKGTTIVSDARTPDKVCQAVEQFRAEVLPTSPTFLNLLLLSKAYERFDLSSLKLITYGTEPMQESTLVKLGEVLPGATLQQTYGLSEVGILRSKSRSSNSIWMKVGGDEFKTKIVNGTLRIKAESGMLGYLNAPSPFDGDGYLDTGDLVEQDGEWIRILGRASEIINVGGLKVFPAEVESVLLDIPGVNDVVVYGIDHPITGKVVCAKLELAEEIALRELKKRVFQHCKDKLAPYKVPGKIIITDEPTFNQRFKRMRREKV
ncbi:ANL family adenylate-forming protein [Marinobacter sp. F4216]|uniref:ANL family adenylate-forming protein n=1 Tax=Marinobacter sp. F4216 TaxID=2874281 RepID=UPI001CC158EE|nr:fatty acid--CoA ligase family protein [Marinobacter sp. F4216]MBZ2167598.1 fatty acid--CoA ligase family protein [Marinobacter sp. F4216]